MAGWLAILAVFLVVVLVVVKLRGPRAREVAAVEKRLSFDPGDLSAVSRALVEGLPDDLVARIGVLVAERKKIEAIKLYREARRVDLKTAKEAIEALEADMRRGRR